MRIRRLTLALLLTAACSGSGGGALTGVTQTIGPAGGTVGSGDGRLTLTIPAGALPADTEIGIRRLAPAEFPPELAGAEAVYELSPDGLQFNAEVTATLVSARQPVAGPGDVRLVVESLGLLSGGLLESATSLATSVDAQANVTEVTGTFTHFSYLALVTGVVAVDGPIVEIQLIHLTEYPRGTDYNVTVHVGHRPESNGTGVLVDLGDKGTNIEGTTDGQITAVGALDPADPLPQFEDVLVRSCTADPVDHTVLFELRTPNNPKHAIALKARYGCRDSGPTSRRIQLLVRKLEAAVEAQPEFAGTLVPRPIVGAHETGFVIADLDGAGVLRSFDLAPGPVLAAVPLRPADGTGDDSVVYVGNDGAWLTSWDGAAATWTTPANLSLSRIADASRYALAAATGPLQQAALPAGLVFVDYSDNEIGFVTEDATGDAFVLSTTERITSSAFASAAGNVTSAFRHSATSPVFFVTEGFPGQLWMHEDPADSAASARLIALTGDQPRFVRGTADFVAVSNTLSDSITIATRDGSGDFTGKGSFPVGDLPVGIDVANLAGGDVAVASTGFNEGTYSITVFTPDGVLVSHTQRATPADCTNPGHVIFAGDGSGDVLVTCFFSGLLYRLDGAAEPLAE